LTGCVPWTVRPIDEGGAGGGGAKGRVAPAAFVESIWEAKLLPEVRRSAVAAQELRDALRASRGAAEARYGRRAANGPCYFVVRGEGRVLVTDTHSRVGLAMVDLAPFDGQAELSIQIGPVLRGTSLRDATGLVRFNDFVNQLQYADAGNELNRRVLEQVLGKLVLSQLAGRRITFVGTAVSGGDGELPLRELVPVELKVEEGR